MVCDTTNLLYASRYNAQDASHVNRFPLKQHDVCFRLSLAFCNTSIKRDGKKTKGEKDETQSTVN